DQRELVLGWVGPEAEGEAVNKAGVKKPNVKATASMRGAPGDSLVVDGITYVFTAEGIQFKESKSVGGGPAARNNNPGNITVDNFQPYAWEPDIGAYPGRNTDGRFAIFPTLAAGKKGAIAWARRFGGSKSIQDYFEGLRAAQRARQRPGQVRHHSACARQGGDREDLHDDVHGRRDPRRRRGRRKGLHRRTHRGGGILDDGHQVCATRQRGAAQSGARLCAGLRQGSRRDAQGRRGSRSNPEAVKAVGSPGRVRLAAAV